VAHLLSVDSAEELLRMNHLPPLRQVAVALRSTDIEAARLILLVYFMTRYVDTEAILLADRCIARIPQRPS